jgi:hypothetical protein
LICTGRNWLEDVIEFSQADVTRIGRQRLGCKVSKNSRSIHDTAVLQQFASNRIHLNDAATWSADRSCGHLHAGLRFDQSIGQHIGQKIGQI